MNEEITQEYVEALIEELKLSIESDILSLLKFSANSAVTLHEVQDSVTDSLNNTLFKRR